MTHLSAVYKTRSPRNAPNRRVKSFILVFGPQTRRSSICSLFIICLLPFIQIFTESTMPPSNARIYVGNLPNDVKERDVEDVFTKYGKIKFCDIKGGRGPLYAFVEFEDVRLVSLILLFILIYDSGMPKMLCEAVMATISMVAVSVSNSPEVKEIATNVEVVVLEIAEVVLVIAEVVLVVEIGMVETVVVVEMPVVALEEPTTESLLVDSQPLGPGKT